MKTRRSFNQYIHGDHNAICDYCGFKFKGSELRYNWRGQRVCKKDWEPRHPQDFVRGIADKQNAPDPRPEVTDSYVVLNTVIYGNTIDGSTTLSISEGTSTVNGFLTIIGELDLTGNSTLHVTG